MALDPHPLVDLGAGADEGDEVGSVDRPPRRSAASMSLKAMISPAARDLAGATRELRGALSRPPLVLAGRVGTERRSPLFVVPETA